MLLYTKRNKSELRDVKRLASNMVDGDTESRARVMWISRKLNPLGDEVRERLRKQIIFHVESGSIDKWLIAFDENTERNVFCKEALSKLTERELGYDITNYLDCKDIAFGKDFNDFYLFDLLEIMMIFSNDEERSILRKRLQTIFEEENVEYTVNDYMLMRQQTGLRSVIDVLRDSELQSELKTYYDTENSLDKARIAAGITQRIFSSPDSKKDTKAYTEAMCKDVAKKWAASDEDIDGLSKLISETVTRTKALNNEISKVRHTDSFTVLVNNPSMYTLIHKQNMSIIELAILSLPERFIVAESANTIRKQYLAAYQVNPDAENRIEKEFDITKLPF